MKPKVSYKMESLDKVCNRLQKYLAAEEAEALVADLVEAVKAAVLAELGDRRPTDTRAADDDTAPPEVPATETERPDEEALAQFSATWKHRFTRQQMSETEFARHFGEQNNARLNQTLMQLVFKGMKVG